MTVVLAFSFATMVAATVFTFRCMTAAVWSGVGVGVGGVLGEGSMTLARTEAVSAFLFSFVTMTKAFYLLLKLGHTLLQEINQAFWWSFLPLERRSRRE